MRILLLSIFALFFVSNVSAQTLDDLKLRKEKTANEIKYTNQLLDETGKNTKASLNKLSILNKQIDLQNRLIEDYNDEMSIIQQSINDNSYVVNSLGTDLKNIRKEYAQLIKQAQRNKGSYHQLVFLLSSQTFNQAYKRLLYTRQITRFRKRQVEQIDAIREVLQTKVEDLNKRKHEKEALLNEQKMELRNLSNQKSTQNNYYSQLQKRQRELRRTLSEKQKVEQKLEDEIQRLIEEEAKRLKEQALTPDQLLLSDNFEKNKGLFPWPTVHGIITDRFGEHAHPVMKTIIIRNNGIDITTKTGERARAIFNGVVSRVFAIPGGNMAVIIRHGQYISVYSNLKEVNVTQGEQVLTKQDIGLIYTDTDDNKTILKFQIWKESLKLNPELWIAK